LQILYFIKKKEIEEKFRTTVFFMKEDKYIEKT